MVGPVTESGVWDMAHTFVVPLGFETGKKLAEQLVTLLSEYALEVGDHVRHETADVALLRRIAQALRELNNGRPYEAVDLMSARAASA